MKLSFVVVGLASVLVLSGCETINLAPQRGTASVTTSKLLPVSAGKRMEGAGVLMSVEFKGRDAEDANQCRVRLYNEDNQSSVFLSLQPNEKTSYVELEPGHYHFGRIGCGMNRVWDLDDIYKKGFDVSDGNVSYIGKLTFVFKDSELNEVKIAGRTDTAAAYLEAIKIPDVKGYPIVSGFTLIPITPELVENMRDPNGFDVHASGERVPASTTLDPLLENLKDCDHKAMAQDPLRLGTLDYVAEFKNGDFTTFKSRVDKNTFSKGFCECVASTLSGYHPTEKGPVEISVAY